VVKDVRKALGTDWHVLNRDRLSSKASLPKGGFFFFTPDSFFWWADPPDRTRPHEHYQDEPDPITTRPRSRATPRNDRQHHSMRPGSAGTRPAVWEGRLPTAVRASTFRFAQEGGRVKAINLSDDTQWDSWRPTRSAHIRLRRRRRLGVKAIVRGAKESRGHEPE